jgi:hypothetical protein
VGRLAFDPPPPPHPLPIKRRATDAMKSIHEENNFFLFISDSSLHSQPTYRASMYIICKMRAKDGNFRDMLIC